MDVQSSHAGLVKRVGLVVVILMQLLSGSIFVGLQQWMAELSTSFVDWRAWLSYAWLLWLINFVLILAWLAVRRRWVDRLSLWWSLAMALVAMAVMVATMSGALF